MKKEFVPYTEALELKQLGFDEFCVTSYGKFSHLIVTPFRGCHNSDGSVTAPTFSQVFRWFREKYDLFCYVELVGDRLFDYMIIGDFVEEEIDYEDGPFNTHEEAELACLKKLLEIVITK